MMSTLSLRQPQHVSGQTIQRKALLPSRQIASREKLQTIPSISFGKITSPFIDIQNEHVVLRQGSIADFPKLADLFRKILPKYDGIGGYPGQGYPQVGSSILNYYLSSPKGGTRVFEEDMRTALNNPQRSLYMVILDKADPQKILGFVCLIPFPYDDPTVNTETAAELSKLYVSPDSQHKGVGGSVMSFALNKAKEMGYRQVYLTTHKNFVEAQKLYHKWGFYHLPPDPVNSKYPDEQINMVKDL